MALPPTKWKLSTLLIVLALLILAPLLLDYFYYRAQERQEQRDDELVARYECEPPTKCVGDFDGDGISDRIVVADRDFVVTDGAREMLRLPYDHSDNTLRTHFAITDPSAKSRLLIYDGASHKPSLRAAFAWDGARLAEAQPSHLEREIISAMARHDDTGGWNERAFRPLLREAQLFVYYFALAIIVAVVLFKRYRSRIARPA
ncbi:MAG TPA: hypothetical protein VJ023_11170 [Pyrinomonadaceae bacterium]|nr:hypothetical protein [Pyrinomonadaceae bacterium]